MNETKTMGLRLPVQAAVDRAAMGTTLAAGAGVEASGIKDALNWVKDHITGSTTSIAYKGRF
jgi:hypothetical protein